MLKILFVFLSVINLYALDAFVSAKDLKNAFDDEKLVIIDISDSYTKSHITGSIDFNVKYLINKKKSYNALKSHKRLEEIFANIGLDNDSTIIIYGRSSFEDISRASFLAFVLLSSGFENVSILDGAYMSWVFEYASLVTKKQNVLEKGSVTLKEKDFIVDANRLIKDRKSLNIIDARDANMYAFSHIKGATNCSFKKKFKNDYSLKPREEIQDMCLWSFRDTTQDIVVYADDIYTASLEWYIINRFLGFENAKIYYSSFGEYKDLDLEISSYK